MASIVSFLVELVRNLSQIDILEEKIAKKLSSLS